MTLLEAHRQAKTALLAHLRDLAEIAGAAGLMSVRADLLETRVPKLEDERFHLVVLGEFNSGKSTFVNALLGAEVLPTGVTPTTAAINHVVYAPTPVARAVLVGGTEKPIPVSALADWVTVEGAHAAEVAYVEVGYPAELLADRVTLVDTPGVNDLNDQRAEITYGYIPRADAVLFLLDAGQALKESERAFLSSRLLERSRERLVFVVGKIDQLAAGEVAEVVAYVRAHLAGLVADPPVFAISARRALAGDVEGSGITPLLAHLTRTLTEERGRLLLDNAAAEGGRCASYLRRSLGIKRHALDLSVGELEERVAHVRAQLTSTQESLAQLHQRIQAEGEAVKAKVRLDLDGFAARFVAALPAEIDAADPGELRRFLPLFIQDKFKEWAEREGDACGALLERLAEEVISVTAENARAATAALAGRFGAGDARLEVDVDTFKYDVSVYAVGALGTTIFLFVNTLVGGLLTLAAPILAIVLQSRVAAEIRDQAKRAAPEAIARAAAAVAPQFARIVDEFVARLEEYVTSAGDRLYAGITEVLDRAIQERRGRGEEIGPLTANADEQIRRLEGIERELGELRSGLWN